MPVIVRPDDFSRWLDCAAHSPADVADITRPAPVELMEAIPISDRVNKVANSGPDILEPVEPAEEQPAGARQPDEDAQMRLL
jgi:putative SOS response-associated peptidase YedK